jgi:polysaccharide export outer membrane protein
LYRDPTITVVMRKQRVNKVTVIGAVNKPGTYELPRGNSNLLQALVAAGHLAKDAGPEVEIRRPALRSQGPPLMPAPSEQPNEVAGGNHAERTSYNAAPAIMRPASSMKVNLVVAAREARGGYYLDDGDVVMVEKKMVPPIHVLGLVQKPGQFELPPHQDLHLLDAIALAGGRSMQFADKVHIIRHVPGKEQPIVVKISMRDAKRTGEGNMRLAPGDIVSVEETPVTMVLETVKGLFSFGASFGVL